MIQMFHVTKAYPGDPPVLLDINLDIEKGEFVFLTGPSGAGKTTLLKLMFLAERPTAGQMLIAGRNIARLRESGIPYLRRNIGVVFQDFKLLPNRTVAENVGFTLDVLGMPARRGARARRSRCSAAWGSSTRPTSRRSSSRAESSSACRSPARW